MVVNMNTRAWDRMYDDYYSVSVPHLCWDGGEQVYHGTPPDMEAYEPGLLTSCDRAVEQAFIDLSVEYRGSDEIGISLTAQITDPGGTGCCDIRGDINHNGSQPDVSDLVYLVTYMFDGGSPPVCEDPVGSGYYPEADINSDGSIPNISDLVDLVTYMFMGCPDCLVPCPGEE
jgi:hypothetical protein